MSSEGIGLSYSSIGLNTFLKMVLPRENKVIDYRVSLPSPEHLSRMLSGLANTGGGVIVLGVDKPDVIVGINEKFLDRNVEAAIKLIYGLVDVDCSTYSVGGRVVGVIKVKSSEVPVSTAKGYFKRDGEDYTLLEASQLFAKFVSAPDHTAVISSLSETISSQSNQFEKLRKSFEKANSWKKKIFYFFVGALISAIARWAMPGVIDSIYNFVMVRF